MKTRIRTQTLPNSCLHHDHDYHQLVIAYQGYAEFEVEGQGGRVDPLHGCLVPGGDVHFYEGIGENQHIIMDVPFDSACTNMERLFEKGRYFEIDAGLKHLLNFIHQESRVWSYYPEASEGITQTFLSGLHQRIFSTAPRSETARGRLDLRALDHYIEEHLDETLTTSDLAGISNVSAGHFHELFRQAKGMTPGQYLLNARMHRARDLILSTNLSLVDISAQVGFASQSALTHAFRRFFGETPGSLRRTRNN